MVGASAKAFSCDDISDGLSSCVLYSSVRMTQCMASAYLVRRALLVDRLEAIEENTPYLLNVSIAGMRTHRSHHALHGAGAARLDLVVSVVKCHVVERKTAKLLHVCIVGMRTHRSHHALYGAGDARLDPVVSVVEGHSAER